jgi:hypothetical protein
MRVTIFLLLSTIYLYAESCHEATNRVNFYFIKAKQQIGMEHETNWCKVKYALMKGFEASEHAQGVCGALYNNQFLINKLETYQIAKERCKEEAFHFKGRETTRRLTPNVE